MHDIAPTHAEARRTSSSLGIESADTHTCVTVHAHAHTHTHTEGVGCLVGARISPGNFRCRGNLPLHNPVGLEPLTHESFAKNLGKNLWQKRIWQNGIWQKSWQKFLAKKIFQEFLGTIFGETPQDAAPAL